MGNIVALPSRPPSLPLATPTTAGELRFDPLPAPRHVMKSNGCFFVCDGFFVDARGRRLFARLWQAPTAAATADLHPIDGLGPL